MMEIKTMEIMNIKMMNMEMKKMVSQTNNIPTSRSYSINSSTSSIKKTKMIMRMKFKEKVMKSRTNISSIKIKKNK